MIADGIIGALLTLMEGLVALLPSWSISGATFEGITPYLQTINSFVPLSEALVIAQAMLAGGIVWLTAWALMRVIDWLPFT